MKERFLRIKEIETNSVWYIGQAKMTAEGSPVMKKKFIKCGYGKMIWPDGSVFEGHWFDDKAFGIGVFRA